MLGCLANPSSGTTKEVEIIGNPVVDEDRVTIRVKVKDDKGKPVMGLEPTDFKLKTVNIGKGENGEQLTVKKEDWKSPEETIPPPAWIIVLLDLSGSMKQLDSGGSTKLEGAVTAIREFIQLSAKRGGNTQIAIVPFGESGGNCYQDYPVNEKTLDKFFPAGDFKLQNYLDYLAGLTPCAATNLYQPLDEAIRFFGNKDDSRFYIPVQSEDSEESKTPEPQPRLSIILLSDGFHNKPNKERDFERLTELFQRNPEIVVHTLGYGLTPEQLAKKYSKELKELAQKEKDLIAKRRATSEDSEKESVTIPVAEITDGEKLLDQLVAIAPEEVVDQKNLAEIAQLTGGIAEFSGDARDIAKSLQVFLNSLLGEYEITYTEPNAERGSKHSVSVIVDSAESEAKSYSIDVFGRSLPLPVRLSMIVCTFLLLGLGGILPFSIWAKKLKYEGVED